MKKNRKLQIAVIGSEKASALSKKIAFNVGVEIAKKNHILINGGLGGVMSSSARGAKSQGGLVVGIIPGDMKSGNKYLDVKIATNIGKMRNFLIAQTVDGIVVIQGGSGTLSELAVAYETTPIVAIPKSGGIAKKYSNKYLDHRKIRKIVSVVDEKKSIDTIEKMLKS